jgi:hypothetical protein
MTYASHVRAWRHTTHIPVLRFEDMIMSCIMVNLKDGTVVREVQLTSCEMELTRRRNLVSALVRGTFRVRQ